MTLNAVVLPAPFGPMSPKIWPGSIEKLTWSRATRPPKRMVSSSSTRSGSAMFPRLPPVLQLGRPPPVGHDALRAEDHHDHQGGPEDEHPVLGEAAEALGQVPDEHGADDGAGQVARAAQHDGGEEQDRQRQVEGIGVD